MRSAPLPALALMRDEAGSMRTVVLAQCDGQRVLLQDATGAFNTVRYTATDRNSDGQPNTDRNYVANLHISPV